MMHNPRFSSNSDPRSIHRLERKKKISSLSLHSLKFHLPFHRKPTPLTLYRAANPYPPEGSPRWTLVEKMREQRDTGDHGYRFDLGSTKCLWEKARGGVLNDGATVN